MDKYIVYKHTAPNGKVYIGQTKKTTSDRWKSGKGYTCHHHGYFWKAIEKYGWDNIKHEILFDGLTKELADYYEQYFIEIYRSTDRLYGYNCQSGGSRNYEYSEDSRKRISDSLKKLYAESPPDTSKAREVLQRKQGRRIVQYDLKGNRIAEYESAYDAYLNTGISNKRINSCLCCPERNLKAGGFRWKYYEDAPDKLEPFSVKPKILLIDDDGNILGKYSTLKEAEKRTGISASTVGNILKHVFSYSKVLKGKTFIYENQVQL